MEGQWEGLKLFDEDGKPAAYVYKGPAPDDDAYAVDGLSGATITSRGVTNLIQYWASDDGYGPFLQRLETEINGAADTAVDNTAVHEIHSTPSIANDCVRYRRLKLDGRCKASRCPGRSIGRQ